MAATSRAAPNYRVGLMSLSLCETCQNMREVRTARSRFLLCELSTAKAVYPKYPPQPVVRCSGYQGTSESMRDARNAPAQNPAGNLENKREHAD